MKNVEIYLRNGHFYIQPMVSITVGVHIGAEPIAVVVDDISDEILGQNILDTIALPIPKVTPPKNTADWNQFLKPFFKVVKVRSWKAFMVGTQLISIEEQVDGMIQLLPTVNNGKSFLYRPKNIQFLSSDCTPAELGKAVRHLFQEIIPKLSIR